MIRLRDVARKAFGFLVVMLALATTMGMARSTSLAIAPTEAFMWQISGPTQIRFQGVASSKTGNIAYAVPDPAGPTNPPAKGYRTSDGGRTWTQMSNMESRYWISVDTSANGQIVFATGSVHVSGAFQSAVFKSTDGGSTWNSVLAHDPATPGTIHADVSVSDNGQKVVVGSNVGAMYSIDEGATWSAIRTGAISGVAISGDGTVLMAQERYVGIHKTIDAGNNWTTVETSALDWSNIELSTDGSRAFAVATRQGASGGAFVSRDGGSSWTDAGLTSTFSDGQYATGAMSPDGLTMIASSYYSVPRVSTDGGTTWTVVPTSLSNVIGSGWAAFAVSNPDPTSLANSVESKIFAVTENNRIARFGFGPPLSINEISPNRARHTGGRTVIISGESLVGVTSVTFGGIPAQSFSEVSDTSLSVVTPAHPAGEVQVVVDSQRGSDSATFTFVDDPPPVITSITPSRIATDSISFVTIRGVNLDNIDDFTIGNTVVDWGFYGVDTIIAFVGPHPAGTVPVIVSSEMGEARSTIVFDEVLNPVSRNATTLTSFDPTSRGDMEVRTLARLGDSGLVVGGAFTDAGGVMAADCVAGWNGRDWYALGSDGSGDGALDCDGNANRFVSRVEAAPDGSVVAYGRIAITGSADEFELVMWDGSVWRGLAPFTGLGGEIYSMHVVSKDRLVVGGGFQNLAGVSGASNVAVWDRGQWMGLGSAGGSPAINDTVWEVFQSPSGNIYINGEFEDAGGEPLADVIAMWNGTRWTAVGDDGAGGSRFERGPRLAMAVDVVAGVEVVYVGVSTRYPVNQHDVLRYVGGRWERIFHDDVFTAYGALEVRSGGLFGVGIGVDSRTRSANSAFSIRDGSVEAFSLQTIFDALNVGQITDYAILADGRVAFTFSVGLAPTVATPYPMSRIVVFDPIDYLRDPDSLSFSAPMLPATGGGTDALFVIAVLLLVVGSVMRVMRRSTSRLRVR
jgi:hypothetical protein